MRAEHHPRRHDARTLTGLALVIALAVAGARGGGTGPRLAELTRSAAPVVSPRLAGVALATTTNGRPTPRSVDGPELELVVAADPAAAPPDEVREAELAAVAVAALEAPAAPSPAAAPPPPRAVDRAAAPTVRRPPPRPDREGGGPPAAPPAAGSAAAHPDDFPDPFVFRSGTYWYAASTQRGFTQVPVMRSLDLRTWETRGDALPRLPEWAAFGHVWAPSVAPIPTGFALFYTTRDRATGLQCISRAVSVLPEGPYVDTSTGPLICQWERGGSIDPTPFFDEQGGLWLLWKSEGTLDGEPTRIWSALMDGGGERLLDEPHELLATSSPWEGPIIEAPTMVLEDGRYHLLYSGNRWETARYATGQAICDGPAGPCRRVGSGPVLETGVTEAGPGGGSAFRDLDGSLRFAYHAWDPATVAYPAGVRRLHLARLTFDGERAVIVRGG